MTPEETEQLLGYLRTLSTEKLAEVISDLPPKVVDVLLQSTEDAGVPVKLPLTPMRQARELDAGYRTRPHLTYLSKRIDKAIGKVELGRNQHLIVEMPPRMGKTSMATIFTPLWILRKHPEWPIALTSHDGRLATSWGRQIRRYIEGNPLGIGIARDAGAAGAWETTQGGTVYSTSIRESFTGRGAKVLVIDDPHKDFADAHSQVSRNAIWDWWRSVALLRLHPPYLVIVVQTRWHEDDLVGRLLSHEYEGNPDDWERIKLPAIAEDHDVLGRKPGDPLFSPLVEENREQALVRWEDRRKAVGSYVWSALMQQSPSPSQGQVFDVDWWRFWTTDPSLATEDGKVELVDPRTLTSGRWLDSWDMTFKAKEDSDFVAGTRWVRHRATRYLVGLRNERLSFTGTIAAMRDWARPDSVGGTGHLVHEKIVEDKANGTAVIDLLKEEIPGLVPVPANDGKEVRARLVTPEIEAGNVRLPHPAMPGFEWVQDMLSQLREFPHGAHDDMVDSMTHALFRLRDGRVGRVTVPGRRGTVVQRDIARAAGSMRAVGTRR